MYGTDNHEQSNDQYGEPVRQSKTRQSRNARAKLQSHQSSMNIRPSWNSRTNERQTMNVKPELQPNRQSNQCTVEPMNSRTSSRNPAKSTVEPMYQSNQC
ncbi:hypothetical protein AVEN_222218-1 [Araneus ventricosus]|uniref:Uncharacterized protein n=1 Tax=Araneus ventricosus TaxID=182803 RepID=A0A4Y2VNI0_ARAVE|nr:hypothetical protein AVEN_222218-1 [Araneus ventricosus]